MQVGDLKVLTWTNLHALWSRGINVFYRKLQWQLSATAANATVLVVANPTPHLYPCGLQSCSLYHWSFWEKHSTCLTHTRWCPIVSDVSLWNYMTSKTAKAQCVVFGIGAYKATNIYTKLHKYTGRSTLYPSHPFYLVVSRFDHSDDHPSFETAKSVSDLVS